MFNIFFSNYTFAQSIGTEVENGSIYNSIGLDIHYNIVYMGEGDCGRKYTVTVFINNTGDKTINIAGSLVDIDNSFEPWENNFNNCNFQGQILFGYYPKYELWKIIEPDFSDKNSHIIYMKYGSNSLPKVTWNIVPRIEQN